MASDVHADDDLSPQDFLRRVRAMTEERDREDRQRVTDIEKDIMQSREQRRARRADHARSLSNAPLGLDKVLSPTTNTKSNTEPSAKEPETASPTRAENPTLSRTNTLSWQQRRRPLSQIALENNHIQNHVSPVASPVSPEKEMARADIAQSLASKDPSWFKQTADRGIGSAALRRTPEPEYDASPGFKLPAMDQLPQLSFDDPSLDVDALRISPKFASQQESSYGNGGRDTTTSALQDAGTVSMGMSAASDDAQKTIPKLEPTASANSGRSSPTKGMGGFVQSAMMKRSDSVSKRWSATPTPGLQRAGSTAGDRGSYLGRSDSVKTSAGSNAMSKLNTNNRLSGLSNEPPKQTASRPTSTYITNSITQNVDEKDNIAAGPNDSLTKSHSAEIHSRSRSVALLRPSTPNPDDLAAIASPPLSPSKRWSPTKSSWLESKLSQPEEKPKATPPPSQPSWMTDLAKAKQQRGSVVMQDSQGLDTTIQTSQDVDLSKSLQPPSKPAGAKPEIIVRETSSPLPPRKLSNAQSPPVGPKPNAAKSPETGKIDFRANLKSRAPPPGAKQNDQPEFQSRFGSLRKAETKNYVAPDELKSNILRGKAGLSQTGGPAKREKVDELKESLLKRKEEMKTKAANGPRTLDTSKESTTPEALLRRQNMNKVDVPKSVSPKPIVSSKIGSSDAPTAPGQRFSKEVAPIQSSRLGPSSLSRASSKSSNPMASPIEDSNPRKSAVTPTTSGQSVGSTKLASKINPGLANILARGPPGLNAMPKSTLSPSSSNEGPDESRELTHMTKGRARGPKRRAPKTAETTSKSPTVTSTNLDVPVHMFRLSDLSLASTSPSAQSLTFATSPPPSAAFQPTPRTIEDVSTAVVANAKLGLPANPKVNLQDKVPSVDAVESASEVSQLQRSAELVDFDFSTQDTQQSAPSTPAKKAKPTINFGKTEKALPDTVVDSPSRLAAAKFGAFNFGLDAFDIENGSSLPSPEPIKLEQSRVQTPTRQRTNVVHLDMRTPVSQPGSPTSPIRSPDRISVREAIAREVKTSYVAPLNFQKAASPMASPTRSPVAVSVRDAASRWSTNGMSASSTNERAKSPIKLPKQEDEDNAMIEAGLKSASFKSSDRPSKPPTGLGLRDLQPQVAIAAGANKTPKLTISPAVLDNQNEQKQQASPVKRSRPPSMTIKVPPPDSPLSPIPHTSEAARMFSEIFDDQPRISGSTEIDVLTVIENYPVNNRKIETIKSQMQELSEDGTLIPMPNGREHILFEDSMYVCVHIFKDSRFSRNTEVYFWTGHNVQAADAQMYARNIAKVNTGKFVPVKQGKEPAAFFQALGGIIITFRGSRVKKRASTGLPEKFVLCGRKHLGHIAFDEVDFARTSFCSGFPYLVSNIKDLYLWRGAGASADELGCARLIAMDIGLTPDVTEIIEGEEPASFLNLFPSSPASKVRSPGIPPSATHWRLKATIGDKYRARLFRITQETISTRKNSAFQVSNFFGGLANSAAHLLPTSISPSTPSFTSPVSSLQSPFTESSLSEKKSLSVLPSSHSTPRTAEMPSEVACNVDEIVPFCREDLQGEGVWVLDAFFEVYIILSPLSNSQNHAFSAALLFAQDYVILAASVEDRPFIPVSTVVLEGAPKDMKAVFRRWTDQSVDGSAAATSLPTSKLMAGKPLKRGGSMRTVGLAAALAAVQR